MPHALHPRLTEVAELEAARAGWPAGGVLRLEEALAPGLAAELATWFTRVPLRAGYHADQAALTWSFEVQLPHGIDPQYPDSLNRLIGFLDRELPALAGALTGRRLRTPMPGSVHLWVWRRGAYVDDGKPLAPPGGLDVLLGLTGPRWPAELGGHLEVAHSQQCLPPGFDTLDLFDRCAFRVPLITARVYAMAVRTFLVPADGETD
ncbi:MAG TPA: hypothetical protein VML75_24080 [Kofleriaceae bacterium]|nr:hypothetical protein [Kofleriaceae bacterium]